MSLTSLAHRWEQISADVRRLRRVMAAHKGWARRRWGGSQWTPEQRAILSAQANDPLIINQIRRRA